MSKQNRDGGWPYVGGVSWTEPTVYAVMALLSASDAAKPGEAAEAARRGIGWIRNAQRPDGGWPPQLGIEQSTWVTALAALVPPEHLGAAAHARSIQWLLSVTGQESTWVYRLREWLLGNSQPTDQEFPGWPWFPGTAAWVGPTSLAILALDKEGRRNPGPRIQERIASGRRFLLARMCHPGGWNHGSARALGYESWPYPETTGMALMALRGMRSAEVDRALAVARGFLDGCRSGDALNWLRLGLRAHGQLPPSYCPPAEIAYRTLSDGALELLVSEAERGRDLFWS